MLSDPPYTVRLLPERGQVLAVAGAVAAGVAAAWLAVGSSRETSPAGAAALGLVVGWSFIASGLVARRQRPDNPLGNVMVFIGFAWFATFLADSDNSVLFTIGTAVEDFYLVGFVYLILSFPSGKLRSRLERGLFTSAVVIAAGVEIAWLLFAKSGPIICRGCPANLLEVTRNDSLARGILDGQRSVGVALSVFTVGLLARRWRGTSDAERTVVAPVLWAGTAMFAALALSVVNDILDHPLGEAPAWTRAFVFASVPVAALAVLVRRRLARGAIADLVVELRKGGEAIDLRRLLSRALGDPSLQLAYWLPEGERYVDGEGAPVELPRGGETDRDVTFVNREGTRIAALVHDPVLRENPQLVDSVCAAALLRLENERLNAELRAKVGELRASRVRLVEATQAERRRIERDLHDGTQQRLVSIAMTLGLAESKLSLDPQAIQPVLREARESLAVALDELRELSQGIHPGVLLERGLSAALEDLAGRASVPVHFDVGVDRRLPERVEAAAYFVASEALANVAKHAQAREVRLSAAVDGELLVVEVTDDGIGGARLEHGSGVRGLVDRVEALGGRLVLSSPSSKGTTLRVELPCA